MLLQVDDQLHSAAGKEGMGFSRGFAHRMQAESCFEVASPPESFMLHEAGSKDKQRVTATEPLEVFEMPSRV